MKHYVYIYSNDEGTPYYVGKGIGKRIRQRHRVTVPTSSSQMQMYFFDTEQEAFDTEIQLIEFFGRKQDGGLLHNICIGGPGTPGMQHTNEAKERIRSAQLGSKKPPLTTCHKLAIKKALAKTYLITEPTGLLIKITNLSDYCKSHNLNLSAMVSVSKGRRPHHKGYKVRRELV